MLLYAKNTKEEASSRHEGESSSSDSSDSNDNNGDDDETGTKCNTCYGASDGSDAGDGGGGSTGAGGGSAEWMQFLIPRAIVNAWCYGKGQSILVKKIEKTLRLGKSKNRRARKGKSAKKLVKNSSKTAGRKIGGLLGFNQTQPLGKLG